MGLMIDGVEKGLMIDGVEKGLMINGVEQIGAAAAPKFSRAFTIVSRGTGGPLVRWPNPANPNTSVSPDPPTLTWLEKTLTLISASMEKLFPSDLVLTWDAPVTAADFAGLELHCMFPGRRELTLQFSDAVFAGATITWVDVRDAGGNQVRWAGGTENVLTFREP